MAGRGAAPAGLVAIRHSGGGGAPPGTTRSPCQELADVWTAAIGLSPSWAERLKRKARPAVEKTPLPARREAPAASRNGGGHHNGQRLSARRPSCLEGREEHSPDAMRIAERRPFALEVPIRTTVSYLSAIPPPRRRPSFLGAIASLLERGVVGLPHEGEVWSKWR